MHELAIVWFRKDLRLADNPALAYALDHARTLLPVVIESPEKVGGDSVGQHAAASSWRTASLASLDSDLRSRGAELAKLAGDPNDPAPLLAGLAVESGATLLAANRVWDPASLASEHAVTEALRTAGVEVYVGESAYLSPPGDLTTAEGKPYRVFTPFFRAWEQTVLPEKPFPAPERIVLPEKLPRSAESAVAASATASAPRLSRSGDGHWHPGEKGAQKRLANFIATRLESYDELRDRPDMHATSELSPHLAAGEITPRQVADAVTSSEVGQDAARPYLRQLAWREFAAHVLHAYPDLATRPLRPEFEAMPWDDDAEGLKRWQAGETGYPLVDAGMRQLAQTGWMHNRVRLVAASLLTKHLLIPWQQGEEHFRRILVDYDLAQNAFNWQWVAGSGADAAPYFRIFNPTLQAQRFDPSGAYIRRWVPELQRVPSRWIAEPWRMPPAEAEAAAVRIATDYPEPIVDHKEARERALAAYAAIKS